MFLYHDQSRKSSARKFRKRKNNNKGDSIEKKRVVIAHLVSRSDNMLSSQFSLWMHAYHFIWD